MRSRAVRFGAAAALAALAAACASPKPSGSQTAGASPTPSPVASLAPTPATSIAPSPDASASPQPLVVVVPFPDDPAGRSLELTIVAESGLLGPVRAATAAELALVDLGAGGTGVTRLPAEGEALVVAWAGTVCDLTARMTVPTALDRVVIEEGMAPGCDLVPLLRGVVLTLTAPTTALTTAELVRSTPVEAIARSQAEATALGYWGPTASVTGVRFGRAAALDPRLEPPERVVWAIAIDSGELPGSCPSFGPEVDPFTERPCRAAASATMFLDAATGAYLGVSYGG